jgi:glycosyltransferase involved in cell wall biosynthesis
MSPKLSIIIPTVNRIAELGDLLSSIPLMNKDILEILIIDQNYDNGLSDVIEEYKQTFEIKHYRIRPNGASNARNYGISKASGEIFCFPDDDCRFYPETIQIALETIDKKSCDVVFGKCVDTSGKDSITKWSKTAGYLSRKNCENKFVEATMFAKRAIFEDVLYEETLGVGTFHGSGEAYDLVLRLLKQNKMLYYDPVVVFYHPNKVIDHSLNSSIKRTYSYYCGFSKLCLKHNLYAKLLRRIVLVTGFIPFSVFFARNKTRYYCAELLGIFSGMIVR